MSEPDDDINDNTERGLYAVAAAIENLAEAVKALGNKNADTDYGAIEALGMMVRDGASDIASSIGQELANAIDRSSSS